MLEAINAETLRARRDELTSLLREVNELLPKVQKLTEGTEFGVDALAKGVKNIEAGQRALEGEALAVVVESVDQLTRTLNVFRGVLQRIG